MKSLSLLRVIINYQAIISIWRDFNTLAVNSNGDNCIMIENGICMPHSYNKRHMPSMPISIEVAISILTLTEVDDKLATVEFLGYVLLVWQDPRLLKISNNITDRTSMLDNNWILLSEEWTNKIWQPDLFITGMKDLKHTKWKSNNGNAWSVSLISIFLRPLSCIILSKIKNPSQRIKCLTMFFFIKVLIKILRSTMGTKHYWRWYIGVKLTPTIASQILLWNAVLELSFGCSGMAEFCVRHKNEITI